MKHEKLLSNYVRNLKDDDCILFLTISIPYLANTLAREATSGASMSTLKFSRLALRFKQGFQNYYKSKILYSIDRRNTLEAEALL